MDSTIQTDDGKVEEPQNQLRLRRTIAQIAQDGDQELLTDHGVRSDGREDASLNAQSLPDTASAEKDAVHSCGGTEDGADTGVASPIASPQADGVYEKKLSRPITSEFVPPRPFKITDWEYEPGNLKAIESGDYMLSRATEYKFQAGCPPRDKKAFCSFLLKSFKYMSACMNSRKNGTIYFGIADTTENLHYGQICGIEMDSSLRAEYYDTFHKLLPKCFPDTFETVRRCLVGPIFVQIKNTNRWIIEIDIEPAYPETKEEMFSFNREPIREKYDECWTKSEKKAEKKKKDTGLFRRDGSETQYIDKSEVQFFKMAILPQLAGKRKREEDAHREQIAGKFKKEDSYKVLFHLYGVVMIMLFLICVLK